MDFIENIGERYLIGKANAVPQQLENLAKKQFKGDGASPGKPTPQPTSQSSGKDKEIEKLRKELAEAKLSREKQASQAGSVKPSQRKSHSIARSTSGKSSKPNHVPHAHSKHNEGRHERAVVPEYDKPPRRGRSDSIKTAFAARPQMADLFDGTGSHKSHSTGRRPQNQAPEPGSANLPAKTNNQGGKSPVTRSGEMHRTAQIEVSERARSATDLCVVEVTEEESPARRPRHPGGTRVVEVIKEDKYRTRYVIR